MRPEVGVADFLTALAVLGPSNRAADRLARLLGFDLTLEPQVPPQRAEPPMKAPTPEEDMPDLAEQVVNLPRARVPVVFEPIKVPREPVREPSWWRETEALPEEAPGQAWARLPVEPLFEPSRERDILRALVTRHAPGRRIDVAALARLIARREPYQHLPMGTEARVARSVAVAATRTGELETFEQDVRNLACGIRTLVGRTRVSVSWFPAVPDALPDAEVVIVIARSRRVAFERSAPVREWFHVARRALAHSSSVRALIPGALLEEAWTPLRTIEWSRRTAAVHLSSRYASRRLPQPHHVLKLATLLSPAVRVEPALCRAMRLACMPHTGPEVESALRESRLVAVANPLGFHLESRLRKRLRQRAARHSQGAQAFALVEGMHQRAAPVVRLEEQLVRLALQRPQGWEQASERTLRQATRATSETRAGLARWVERTAADLPDELRASTAFAEAVARARSVLGSSVARNMALARLPEDLEAFLAQAQGAATEELELLALEPVTGKWTESDWPLAPGESVRIARQLGTSNAWVDSLGRTRARHSFRWTYARRTIDRVKGRTRPVKVLCNGISRSALESELGGDVTSYINEPDGISWSWADPFTEAIPADVDAVVARADVALRSSLIERARSDPSFILGLLERKRTEGDLEEARRYAFSLSLTSAEILATQLLRLCSFAGWKDTVDLTVRVATSADGPAQMQLPRQALKELAIDPNTGIASVPQRSERELSASVAFRPFQLKYRDRPVCAARPIPMVWIAHLYAASCRVFTAERDFRAACVMGERLVATAASSDLQVGHRVVVQLGDLLKIPAHVDRVSEGVAVIALEDDVEQGALPVPQGPPATGVAVALAYYATAAQGLGSLLWGHLRRDAEGTARFVPQLASESDTRGFRGATVLVEGAYAGQIEALERDAEGWWFGRVYRAVGIQLGPTPRSNAVEADESEPAAHEVPRAADAVSAEVGSSPATSGPRAPGILEQLGLIATRSTARTLRLTTPLRGPLSIKRQVQGITRVDRGTKSILAISVSDERRGEIWLAEFDLIADPQRPGATQLANQGRVVTVLAANSPSIGGLQAAGNLLAVAGGVSRGSASVQIFDITEPTHPRVVDSIAFDAEGTATKRWMTGAVKASVVAFVELARNEYLLMTRERSFGQGDGWLHRYRPHVDPAWNFEDSFRLPARGERGPWEPQTGAAFVRSHPDRPPHLITIGTTSGNGAWVPRLRAFSLGRAAQHPFVLRQEPAQEPKTFVPKADLSPLRFGSSGGATAFANARGELFCYVTPRTPHAEAGLNQVLEICELRRR